MPTYSVIEDTAGNESSVQLLQQDGTAIFRAKRTWTIATDTPGLSAEFVKSDLKSLGQLPLEGDTHPDNSILANIGQNVKRESPIYFTASADYQSAPIPPTGSNLDDDPWNQPGIVDIETVTTEREVDEDFDGNAIVNPGTEEPVGGVNRRFSDQLVILKRPFIVFSGASIQTYQDTTNSDGFLTYAAGTGLVQKITARQARHRDIVYYNVTAQILFRKPYRTTDDKAWYHRRVLKGYLELYVGNFSDEIRRALDSEGREMAEPVLLTSSGERLEAGLPAEFEERKLYGSSVYSTMGFL